MPSQPSRIHIADNNKEDDDDNDVEESNSVKGLRLSPNGPIHYNNHGREEEV
jgi:hypothetical protein